MDVVKAIVQSRYGSADVLEYAEIDKPVIGDDEVLVRVRAASIGAWVTHLIEGDPLVMRLVSGLRKPKPVRSSDVAGEVVEVGSQVDGLGPGDEIYGEADAVFAEYAAVSPDAFALKPRNLSFAEAAAVPIAGQTAVLGLRDIGGVQTGRRVLIIGAAGGVGTFAVQIAKVLGAEVTAVCATNGLELVASLGADHVIDYTRENFTKRSTRYDVIYQGAGAQSIAELRGALTESGTLVLSTGEGGRWFGSLGRLAKALAISPFVGHDLRTFVGKSTTDNLNYLTELIEAGQITPIIDRTFPLDEMADAVRHFQHGHGLGKTVVTIWAEEDSW